MALTIELSPAEIEANQESAAASPRSPASQGLSLAGADADRYIDMLVRAIRGARLNAIFPPERPLCTHLSFLAPEHNGGVYPQLHLAPQSGLPGARDIFRVKIDGDLAADFLADVAERPAPAADSRLARKIPYYTRLASAQLMPLSRMSVELRQHIVAERQALFRVVYDRFDIASCQFARYTILLSQSDRFWRKPHVVVSDADLAAPTESFRRIVGRFTADEAELAFVLLSRVEGIAVEDVRRARVGPLLLPGARIGGPIEALLDREQTPEYGDEPRFILCLPEDRAGLEVAAHASGDPLARLYREAVGDDARALIDAKADELDYRVSKERKFVCSHGLRGPLSQLCRDLGAPSIVRGIRLPARE